LTRVSAFSTRDFRERHPTQTRFGSRLGRRIRWVDFFSFRQHLKKRFKELQDTKDYTNLKVTHWFSATEKQIQTKLII
jgi:hypothetical protein